MSELSAVVRFVHLTAAVLLAGGFAFDLLIAGPAFARNRPDGKSHYPDFLTFQVRLARCYVVVEFITAMLALWLQTASVSELSAGTSFTRSAVLTLLVETQYGKVWLVRVVLLLVLAALVFSAGQKHIKENAVAFQGSGFVLSICLLTSLALAGHAAAGEGIALLLLGAADAFHLLATGIWLGGLIPLAALMRQCVRQPNAALLEVGREATRRFSKVGIVTVSILIATGVYNAWNLVGGFAALFGTRYGNLLLIKMGAIIPLLCIAAVNLVRLKPKIVEAPQAQPEKANASLKQLTRNVMIEAVLGISILLIVGHMGVTPPARHVPPDWPFSFRWDWSVLDKAPKARAEVERGMIWAGVGAIALITALTRRRRRILGAVIGFGALGYASNTVHTAVSIDAYPATYKRPAVAYHAISVANGRMLYQESGCIACHGPNGYGDGPTAQGLNPKPVDLTAAHANAHTAGDLYWWLSHGVKQSSAMPGFSQSLNEEERWDLINYMRALSSGDKARSLAPVIEENPWLVAPDFAYGTNAGEPSTLKDHRGDKIVLLVLLNLQDTEKRLKEIANALPRLQSAGVEMIVVPKVTDQLFVANKAPGLIVTEGIREITETYTLFARSFADENLLSATPHVEYLIDRQGYIRARWLPAENDAWRKSESLMAQIDLLRKEKPRAPAPDEHVH